MENPSTDGNGQVWEVYRIAPSVMVTLAGIAFVLSSCTDQIPSVDNGVQDGPPIAGLAEPPVFIANTPADTLLRNLYPDSPELVFCREEVTSLHSGRFVEHGLTKGSAFPSELQKLIDLVRRPTSATEYVWLGRTRVTVMYQQWVTADSGRQGPWAIVMVFGLGRSDDASPGSWFLTESTSISLCDYYLHEQA